MAYSPLGEGELVEHPALAKIAATRKLTPAEVALAWLVRQGDVITIPQSSAPLHIRANRAAAALELDKMTLASLDEAFPPPRRATPLAMI